MRILRHRIKFLLIAIVTIIISIALVVLLGMNFSIEFSGGSVMRYKVADPEKITETENKLKVAFIENDVDILEMTRENGLIVIKTVPIDSDTNRKIREGLGIVSEEDTTTLDTSVINEVEQVSFEITGTSHGTDTLKRAGVSVIAALVGTFFYVAVIFRNVPKPYSSVKFAAAVIVAVIHDLAVLLGIFALLGRFAGAEIDTLFIAAILVVLAFSVIDTIVVFDRIRENLKKDRKRGFLDAAGVSLKETIRRSVSISVVLLLILVSLLVFGGPVLRYFIVALILGVLVSIYSSIFVATPFVAVWEEPKSPKKNK